MSPTGVSHGQPWRVWSPAVMQVSPGSRTTIPHTHMCTADAFLTTRFSKSSGKK